MPENSKTIRVVCVARRKDEAVEISPEDTSAEILKSVGLDPTDYILVKPQPDPDDPYPYGYSERVMDSVADGMKLYACWRIRLQTGCGCVDTFRWSGR